MNEFASFDRRKATILKHILNEVLQVIATQYDIHLEIDKFTFEPDRVEFKLHACTLDENNKPRTKIRVTFQNYAFMWGLQPEHLDQEFDFKGKHYRITGAVKNRKEYPILAVDADDKEYSFAARDVVSFV